MSYRRAFFLLVFFIITISMLVFFLVKGQIDAPPWAIAAASLIVVGGAILAFLPNVHDSTEFVKGMFTRHSRELLMSSQRSYDIDSPSHYRNRENLLANVYHTWIEGALHQSVHNAILIELGIIYKRDAVSRPMQPWEMALQRDNEQQTISS